MGLADGVAIAAAERVERTGGPRAGLFAWRKLATTATSDELRAAALLAAMRCALALAEPTSFEELVALWSSVGRGMWDARTGAIVKDAARAGMLRPATALAEAEARRSGTARAIYAYARCLEVAGDARAASVLGDAAARADKEGAREIGRAARVRRVAVLAKATETRQQAIDEARAIDAADVAPEQALVLARVLLGGGSRFVRATALGLLDGIVTRGGPLTGAALALAARHADDRGDALDPMELDRLLAIFAREHAAAVSARALGALRAKGALAAAKDDASWSAALDAAARSLPELGPLHLRARRILAGEPSPETDDPSPWSRILDAFAALREGNPAKAALALRRLANARRIPAQAWSVVHASLATSNEELVAAAGVLATALFERAAPPPRGWLALVNAFNAAGLADHAARARRRAAVAGEPGAVESLALALTRAGWEQARAGDRARAIATLREAKALAQRATPSR